MPIAPDQLIRPEILRLAAYHVADARGMVKLDAMENPHALPEAMAADLGGRLAHAAINRYPDPQAQDLKAVLRRSFSIPDQLDILLGNGSDELIQILALALARTGAVLMSVEPSFAMYPMIAEFVGMRYVGVPLSADFGLDLEPMLAAMAEHRPALVFLAYPNNPTGNAFDRSAMEHILDAAPGLVVVDEAYHAFTGGLSFLDELARRDNLLVMRTVSKLGLAGLRLGYLLGPRAWLSELDKVRLPYNVNVLTQLATGYALSRVELLAGQAREIIAERKRLLNALRRLPPVEVYDSQANFLLFRVARAPVVFQGLKRRGVLIKNLHGIHPLLEGCLRVTVGTPGENNAFFEALCAELGAT